MKPPPPTERQTQRSILRMLDRCFPDVLYHHSPNGAHLAGGDGARFKQIGALKGDGMKPGWPDLDCRWNHGSCLIEVKRPGCAGRISPDQAKVHGTLAEMGWAPAVVTSPAEAFAFLRERGAPSRVREWREAA